MVSKREVKVILKDLFECNTFKVNIVINSEEIYPVSQL